MDALSEQAQEIEVLQLIYPDELVLHSKTHYSIVVALDTDSERKYKVQLDVKYTPKYPEELPNLEVSVPQKIYEEESDGEYQDSDEEEEDDDTSSVNSLLKIIFTENIEFNAEDLKKLEQKAYDEAAENLGLPSVFSIVASLKDNAEELFSEKVAQAQKEHDQKELEKEMENQKKFIGTKVTRESYMEWRARFRKEMGWDTREEERLKQLHGGKMTGKEIFEKGLGKEEEEE